MQSATFSRAPFASSTARGRTCLCELLLPRAILFALRNMSELRIAFNGEGPCAICRPRGSIELGIAPAIID